MVVGGLRVVTGGAVVVVEKSLRMLRIVVAFGNALSVVSSVEIRKSGLLFIISLGGRNNNSSDNVFRSNIGYKTVVRLIIIRSSTFPPTMMFKSAKLSSPWP